MPTRGSLLGSLSVTSKFASLHHEGLRPIEIAARRPSCHKAPRSPRSATSNSMGIAGLQGRTFVRRPARRIGPNAKAIEMMHWVPRKVPTAQLVARLAASPWDRGAFNPRKPHAPKRSTWLTRSGQAEGGCDRTCNRSGVGGAAVAALIACGPPAALSPPPADGLARLVTPHVSRSANAHFSMGIKRGRVNMAYVWCLVNQSPGARGSV